MSERRTIDTGIWGKLTKASKNLKRLKKMNSPEAAELEGKLDAILAEAKQLL